MDFLIVTNGSLNFLKNQKLQIVFFLKNKKKLGY